MNEKNCCLFYLPFNYFYKDIEDENSSPYLIPFELKIIILMLKIVRELDLYNRPLNTCCEGN